MSADRNHMEMQNERSFLQSLLESALNGQFDQLMASAQKYAVEHKVSIDEILTSSKDGNKRNVLHFACLSNISNPGEDIVELILKALNQSKSGLANFVRGKDKSGNTPLMLVCQLDDVILADKRLDILLKYGGTQQVLARAKTGATALHFAASQGHTSLLSKLVAHGKAALHALSSSGTPLHWAAGGGGVGNSKDLSDTIQELISLGAKPNLANDQGLTPLLLAVASCSDTNASILVKNGSDRGIILQGNVTVFHMAADLNLVKTLKALLDPSSIKVDGEEVDYKDVISKCLSLENSEEETPLDLAVKENHVECVRLLMPGGEAENDTKSAQIFIENNKKSTAEVVPTENEVLEDPNRWKTLQANVELRVKEIMEQSKTIGKNSITKASEYKAAGNDSFSKNDWHNAIDMYSKAIESDPTDATFYSNRSASYMQINEPEKALEDGFYSRFLRPDWSKACFRISVAKLALEDYEDAAVWAWNGITLDDKNDELKSLMQKCINQGKKSHKQKKEKAKSELKKRLTI